MRRALIDADGVTVNIIEIEEGADYPLPEGWRLDDPERFPLPEDLVP